MAKRKKRKKKKKIPKQGLLTKIKKFIPFAIISGLFGFATFAYPIYIDFKEGKWGGGIEVEIFKGNHSDLKLQEDSPVYIYYSTPKEAKETKILVPVQLELHNSANVADQKVRMSIQYEKKNLRSILPEKFMVYSGLGLTSDSKHELITSKKHDYSVYAFESLPQKSRRKITDVAFSSKTDKNNVFVPFFTSRHGLNVKVTTYSHRDKERNWIFRYRGLDFSQQEEIIYWIKEWYAKHVAFDLRKDSTFIEYLSGIIFDKEVLVYTFSPEFVYNERIDVYVPKEAPKKYIAFKFSPYVWSLLFGIKDT